MADKKYLNDMTPAELKAEYTRFAGFRKEREELITQCRELIEQCQSDIIDYKQHITDCEKDFETIDQYMQLIQKYLGRKATESIESKIDPSDSELEWYRKNNPHAKVGRI